MQTYAPKINTYHFFQETNNSVIYWVNIGATRERGSSIRLAPFRYEKHQFHVWIYLEIPVIQSQFSSIRLMAVCSFALPNMSLLDAKALHQRAERPPTLKSHGTLGAELRFAKGCSVFLTWLLLFVPNTWTSYLLTSYCECVCKYQRQIL